MKPHFQNHCSHDLDTEFVGSLSIPTKASAPEGAASKWMFVKYDVYVHVELSGKVSVCLRCGNEPHEYLGLFLEHLSNNHPTPAYREAHRLIFDKVEFTPKIRKP